MPAEDKVTLPHELPPKLRVKADGHHYAVCPACDAETRVEVTHIPAPHRRFVLTVEWSDVFGEHVPKDVVCGEQAVFDLSAHEAHVREAHA